MKIYRSIIVGIVIILCSSVAQASSVFVNELQLINQLVQIERAHIKSLLPYQVYRETIDIYCPSADRANLTTLDISGWGPARRGTEFMQALLDRQALTNHHNSTPKCETLKQTLYNLQTIQQFPSFTIPSLSIQNQGNFSTIKGVYERLALFFVNFRIGILQQDSLLSVYDEQLLDHKIRFRYSRQCENLYGDYTRIYDNNERTLDYLTIQINICDPNRYTSSFQDYIDQILIHELGHHYYYVHDTTKESFENICRKTTKHTCKNEDFVTAYAQKSAQEDYAETFLYTHQFAHKKHPLEGVRLELLPSPRPSALDRKIRYFLNLYRR